MANLSILVFGGLNITKMGETISSFESDKVRALLAYLVVEIGRSHRRETLAGLFWPECSEQTARHNLSQALFNLRKALCDQQETTPYLKITRDAIQFNPKSSYSLDLEQFQAGYSAWEHNREGGNADITPLEDLVERYRGEFLQGFSLKDSPEFEEWMLVQRAAALQQVMAALTALSKAYEQRGNFPSARRCCERQLALDPWREEAHTHLMRLLALEGQRSAALAQYEACKKTLAEALGVEPSPATRTLYEQIRLGKMQPQVEPAIPAADSPAPKLPLPLTPFLGREKELVQLGQMIADPPCRCISLVGPGGIGKTRLALEAAERNKASFLHEAVFISLVSVESVDRVLSAVASGIGCAFHGPADPKMQLFKSLSDKSMLLVLDNVEHLLAEGPNQNSFTDLCIEILQHAPRVKLLVTSREALNIAEEWVYEVGGLDYPAEDKPDRTDGSIAVMLFVQHARRVRPGFVLDAGNQASIARLCRLVEGMPLAIELAATWVRLLPVEEIAAEVARSLDFLNTQMRDIPARHRSMRAVFEPSWQMLSPEEKRVLCRLSAFRGGFTRQAAEQVAGASLLILSSLVIRSLVRRTEQGRMNAGRYEIHELVRQYAASRLAENPAELRQIQERHGAYYLSLLETKDSLLHSPEQKAALNELTGEIHNLREAWDWSVTNQRITALSRACSALRQLLELRSWFKEGELTFRRAADAIHTDRPFGKEEIDPNLARAVMLSHAGFFLFRQGKSAAAHAALMPCVNPLRTAAEQPGAGPLPIIHSLLYLGIVCWELGRYAEAEDHLQEGLKYAQTLKQPWYEAHFTEFLGIVANDRGEYAQARQYLSRALALFRKCGDAVFTAHTLSYYGRTMQALGECAEAGRLMRESLKIAQELNYEFGRGLALDALGQLAYAQGCYLEAQKHFASSAGLFGEMGDAHRLARALNHQGMTALALDQINAAQESFRTALTLAHNGGLMPVVLAASAGLAALQARQESSQQALELLLSILQHPASNQETKDVARELQKELESRLPSQVIEAAFNSVGEKDLNKLVGQYLSDTITGGFR